MCKINLLGVLLGGNVAPSFSEFLAETLEFLLAPSLVLVVVVCTCLLPLRPLGLQFLAGLVMAGPKEIIVRRHGPFGLLAGRTATLSCFLRDLFALLGYRRSVLLAAGGLLLVGLHCDGNHLLIVERKVVVETLFLDQSVS